jgi:hypothetical protein
MTSVPAFHPLSSTFHARSLPLDTKKEAKQDFETWTLTADDQHAFI